MNINLTDNIVRMLDVIMDMSKDHMGWSDRVNQILLRCRNDIQDFAEETLPELNEEEIALIKKGNPVRATMDFASRTKCSAISAKATTDKYRDELRVTQSVVRDCED